MTYVGKNESYKKASFNTTHSYQMVQRKKNIIPTIFFFFIKMDGHMMSLVFYYAQNEPAYKALTPLHSLFI
jgi:hypothetical protein